MIELVIKAATQPTVKCRRKKNEERANIMNMILLLYYRVKIASP